MDAAPARERHWVLVGLMGVGKSTIGRALAARHGRAFLDSDEQLRRTTGTTARAIAEAQGQDVLHELEGLALRAALDAPEPCVIAAAAAVIEDDGIATLLRRRAFVVWLDAPASVASVRAATGAHRPTADEATLRAQRERRAARYAEAADLVTDATRSPDAVVAEVEAGLAAADAH